MNEHTEIILAMGSAAALIIVALAVADHINRAQTVEFYGPYYAVRSSQYPLLES
ncbi:MAG: hypothetical protein SYNGOMJ08_00197 [Candidatus Syntrophoarchaeum sp. GoM_oil]|nr:MAG: hypothetical protein SYNGOMJ08_00197 [Candidatus Syntrophoarchaeum sp. GoM_oil]